VPSQEGFRRNDCGNFPKNATPEHLRLDRQATALIVVQPEALSAELLPQHPILFAEVINDVALLLAQPTGDRNQQQSERVEGPAHWASIAAKTIATGSANCTI
jgi:hypothetical protein